MADSDGSTYSQPPIPQTGPAFDAAPPAQHPAQDGSSQPPIPRTGPAFDHPFPDDK